MIEKTFWARHVRKALHRPPLWQAWKVQDAFNRGLPDVVYCLDGVAGFLELKYVKTAPKRPTTPVRFNVSIEQRRRLQAWDAAGGEARLLVGVEDRVFLLPWFAEPEPLRDLVAGAIWWGYLKELGDLPEALRYLVGKAPNDRPTLE